MSVGPPTIPPPSTNRRAIRVMLVDDSAVIRGLVSRALAADPEIQIIASVADGQAALDTVKRQEVDVAVLDIAMPVMDGLTALPLLLEAAPRLQVIIASTLTRHNADISLKALRAGAKECITKPSTSGEFSGPESFQQELLAKVHALAASAQRAAARADATASAAARADATAGPASRANTTTSATPRASAASRTAPASASPERSPPERGERHPLHPTLMRGGPILLRKGHIEMPEALAIGASTGGPEALFTVLGALPAYLRQPILITQHMPATFTTILAEHLARISQRPCIEGSDGAIIEPGHIYIAPGEFHMVVEAHGTRRVIRLEQTPPENFCRPSVDPMLRSMAPLYGKRLLVAILTGMGQDGLRGCQTVVAHGGAVIAQDEASSVVWGMPGAVSAAGLCHAVLPVGDIVGFLARPNSRASS